uniref:Helix-turn-helix domain-containing protein n=1 Tax=Vibrio parahaemolyticus TaxID=670 RepID=A0A7M1WB16_VIBPH|nr:hypothetical protein VP195_00019 [Vibrio parahaemolyticus]
MYEVCDGRGIICRRCCISRPTLRWWMKQYILNGIDGLESERRRFHSSQDTKSTDKLPALTLEMGKKINLERGVYRLN